MHDASTPADAPLSFAQQRLWFLDQYYGPSNSLYNIPEAVRLSGPLDAARLRDCFARIIRRHETLRAGFFCRGGVPVQEIRPSDEPDFALLDVAEAELPVLLAAEAERPFGLDRDRLLRIRLYRLSEGEHVLLLVMHHIISDGWSMGILYRELNALYSGETLPPLPLQYPVFAREQRDGLAPGVLEPELAWWRERLAGAPPLLELPTTHPRPAVQTFAAGNHRFAWGPEFTESLRLFSRKHNATLFMTLLAGYQALLSRYTGQTDISVGTPLANRTRVEAEPLIGFFANTLVIRNNWTGSPSFAEFLARVCDLALGAYEHQELPFEKLVQELSPERNTSYTPLFQVLFILQNNAAEALTFPGIAAHAIPVDMSTARFDLTLSMEERGGRLEGVLNYNRGLFDAGAMARFAGHLETMLRGAIDQPGRELAALPLLTRAEQKQLLWDWNHTRAPYPDAAVPEVFREQAAQTPDRIAVICNGAALTYRELDAQSDCIGAHLQQAGIESGALVGIVVERNAGLLPGLLGIWKAGAAYVPLDPDYPPDRRQFLETDSGAGMVLTPERISAILAGPVPTPLKASTITPESLAYVIYTSGSTGTPKGVAIRHRSILNLLHAMRFEMQAGPGDVMVALASAAFDMCIPELYLPLLTGATVVLAQREDARDGRRLAQLMESSGATIMQATPAGWTLLLDAGWKPSPRFRLLCGAEALPRPLAARIASLGCSAWNLFGPTETTVWSTSARVDGGPVTIGRPLPNTTVYVLDANRQPVPIGVPGELYIGGDGLATGYWNGPELSAEKFITWTNGQRLFRTGDQVRYREDGQLEFARRLDTQVKIRGYRVELGEVEALLLKHPHVEQAVAAVRNDQIAAWVTGVPCPPDSLRQLLRRDLPSYMVPAQIHFVEALPRSANGKIDRHALAAGHVISVAPPVDLADDRANAPLDPLETRLLGIWRAVLGHQAISVTSSFFEVGGHSLQAVQLLARVHEEIGMQVPLPVLFAGPTVEQLAQYIRNEKQTTVPPGLASIQPDGTRPAFFCVEARPLFWRFGQLLGPDQPFFGMHWPDLETLSLPYRVEEIAARHVALLRAHQPHGPYVVGGWCIASSFAYEIAQQLTAAGEQVDVLFLFDGANPATLASLSLPGRLRAGWNFSRAAVRFHLSQLAALPRIQRPPYVLARLKTLASRAQSKVRYSAYRLATRSPAAVPETFRQIDNAIYAAAASYRPKPYAGRVVYFRRGVVPGPGYFEPDFGWGRYLERGLEVYKIGGKHGEMFRPPHVEEMARIARDILHNRSSCSISEPSSRTEAASPPNRTAW